MARLALVLYSIVATALAGVGVIAVLVMGYMTWPVILAAAAVGAALAVPASVLIARQLA